MDFQLSIFNQGIPYPLNPVSPSRNSSLEKLKNVAPILKNVAPIFSAPESNPLQIALENTDRFIKMGLEVFELIAFDKPPFSQFDASTKKFIYWKILGLYFPAAKKLKNIRSQILGKFDYFMKDLYTKIPYLQDQSLIEACLKGDVKSIKSKLIPEEIKLILYRIAADNGHIEAFSLLNPQEIFERLMNVIKEGNFATSRNITKKCIDRLPNSKLSQILYHLSLQNNYIDFPIKPEVLHLTLLKLVLTNAIDPIRYLLMSNRISAETRIEVYQLAKKLNYEQIAYMMQKNLRLTFVEESKNWDKERLDQWQDYDFITREDKKRACRSAKDANNLEITNSLIEQARLYYRDGNLLKSYMFDAISPYKKTSVEDEIVPREAVIKIQLREFLSQFHNKNQDTRITAYQGKQPDYVYVYVYDSDSDSDSEVGSDSVSELETEESKRYSIFKAVHRFDIFNGCGPVADMKNGHVLEDTSNICKRCLVIKTETGIQGAIQFIIDLSSRNCTIDLLEVSEDHQGKSFGQTLLQSAFFIALLYKCSTFNVDSTGPGFEFYRKHGFMGERESERSGGKLILELTDPNSRTLLLNKMQQTHTNSILYLCTLIEEALQEQVRIDEKNKINKVSPLVPLSENELEQALEQFYLDDSYMDVVESKEIDENEENDEYEEIDEYNEALTIDYMETD